MLKKSFLLSSVLFISLNAHAGFFGGDDFKCGREDAVKALQDYIKSGAGGQLQSNYITDAARFYGKDLQVFQDKLNGISINASNVSTAGNTGSELNCKATIVVNLPAETLEVVKDNPVYLSLLVSNGGTLNQGSIVWNDYAYSVKLADNKKDISVSRVENIMKALYQTTVLAVTKDDIISSNYSAKLDKAKRDYMGQDAYLNDVWKRLPDAIRSSMKKEQVAWVNEKALKCGKLSDADSAATPFQNRIKIYQCQTKMTQERIAFLGGDKDYD
ncbi:lysozyme inhibitor LprI family protein [Yersinia kristensenii]|uniref:lysozyme inhibitor LprI family protein n=1 Tax=Yersinia kristensenii TaxID=28152 RepID=UPI0011A73479|nr:lysozyme inhibitor LprI family protein [Yersinia kristensenii]